MPDSGPPVPEQFSHYRVVRRLGAGGMGQVLEAIDLRDQSRVALKLMWPQLASDPAFRERFEREAHVGALLRSPFTVHLLDYGFASGSFFLVMEYVEGETLEARLRKGPMPAPEALRIAIQVARALEEAEAREVIHRDLKPENVMLTPDGRVKVTDFGIARDAGSGSLTATQLFLGTPQYGAPEQFAGEATVASDRYSLGVMLFRMLTGELPFTGTPFELAQKHLNAPVPLERLAQFPAEVRDTVAWCLAKDPAQRFPNTAALLRALRAAEDVVTGKRPSSGGETFIAPGRSGVAPVTPSGGWPGPGSSGQGPSPSYPPASQAYPPSPSNPPPSQAYPPPQISYGPLPQQAYGASQAPWPAPASAPPPAKRSSRGALVAVVGIGVAIAAIVTVLIALSGGGDDDDGGNVPASGGTPTPTSTVAGSATTAPASVAVTSAPTTPAVTTPVTRAPLPTPVLSGFPTIAVPSESPAREVIDTVNRNGPVYAKAMRDWDEDILSTVFTGSALAQYRKDVQDARAANRKPVSALLSITLTSSSVAGTVGLVATREVWTYTVNGSCSRYTYDELYTLEPGQSAWLISANTYTQVGSAASC